MRKFKCSVCGCDKAHCLKRIFKNEDSKVVEDIIQIKSFVADTIIILRACEQCGTVKADWEKISESKKVSDADREKIKDVQKEYKGR